MAGFLRDGVWTEATPRGGPWDGKFHPNIPDSLDIRVLGAGVTKHGQCHLPVTLNTNGSVLPVPGMVS